MLDVFGLDFVWIKPGEVMRLDISVFTCEPKRKRQFWAANFIDNERFEDLLAIEAFQGRLSRVFVTLRQIQVYPDQSSTVLVPDKTSDNTSENKKQTNAKRVNTTERRQDRVSKFDAEKKNQNDPDSVILPSSLDSNPAFRLPVPVQHCHVNWHDLTTETENKE